MENNLCKSHFIEKDLCFGAGNTLFRFVIIIMVSCLLWSMVVRCPNKQVSESKVT